MRVVFYLRPYAGTLIQSIAESTKARPVDVLRVCALVGAGLGEAEIAPIMDDATERRIAYERKPRTGGAGRQIDNWTLRLTTEAWNRVRAGTGIADAKKAAQTAIYAALNDPERVQQIVRATCQIDE